MVLQAIHLYLIPHINTIGLALDIGGAYFLCRTFKNFCNEDIQTLSLLPMSIWLTDYTKFETEKKRIEYIAKNEEGTLRIKKIYCNVRRDAKIGWWMLLSGFLLLIVGQYL